MALPVVYRRKVGRDLAGAYRWYEEQRACTQRVIRSSGRSQRAEPANYRIETDRVAAGHPERFAVKPSPA